MKTLLLITLAPVLGGCACKAYHQREWDAQGNLIGKVDVTLVACLTKTQAKDIVVIAEKKMLFVGDFSQVPDAQSIKTLGAVAEGMFPLWLKAVLP